jgi:hypothetical protein
MKAIRPRDVAWSGLAAVVLASSAAILLATPVAAAGGCLYTIDGQDLDAASSPERAIKVSNDQSIVLTASGPGALGQLHIAAWFWPTSVEVPQPAPTTASTWTGTVDLAAQPVAVQGLYQIEISKDPADCPPSTGWLQISGGNPFTTVPGAIGTGMAVVGSIAVVVAIRGALAGRGGAALGAIGGALIGLGALVVAQQSGAVPADARSAAVWAVLPGAIGGTVTRTVGRAFGRGAPTAEPQSYEPPQTTAAEPPPPPPPAPAAEPPPPPPTAGAEPPPAGAAAEPPPSIGADPPRVSYAHLEAPDAVVALAPFDLDLGLAAEPDADVDAAPIVRPAWSHGAYTLTIQLLADGFERIDPGPDPWRIDLEVTAPKPYPTALVKLRAVATDKPVRARQIRATYSVEGQVMGVAARQIAVVDDASRLEALQPAEPRPPATLSTPRGEEAPDLTITIEHQDDQSGGAFWVQLLTRNGLGVRPDSTALPIDLGSGAQEFLQGVITSVRANEGKASLRPALVGIGHQIARQLPKQFWDVFGQVAATVAPRPPSIQILSAEAHIPWELAVLPDAVDLVDQHAPRFLGAQANVARWVIGEPPPRVPPPARLGVTRIAVISGVFTGPATLEEAEAEADAMEDAFGADPIQAVDQAVLECLSHTPAYDVIHFAVHGSYTEPGTSGAVQPRILLADGTFLDENPVMGLEPLPGTPLVFLNACQVGSGHQVLGDYAGMAAAFLYAGAAAVIAPLWSIEDAAAKDIGLRFYEQVFAGASPAEALRVERASFLTSPGTASSTFLAYQYYGHPSLKVERST